MADVDYKFNITSFSLLGTPANKAELTIELKFKQLTSITVTMASLPTTPTGGEINKGAQTAAITFSQTDFASLLLALPIVPVQILPLILTCDDANPGAKNAGKITVQSMSLGVVIPAVARSVVSMLPPPPPTGGALEQIAYELQQLNAKFSEGLNLLRDLRAEKVRKPSRAKNVRSLPAPKSKSTFRAPRAKTGTIG